MSCFDPEGSLWSGWNAPEGCKKQKTLFLLFLTGGDLNITFSVSCFTPSHTVDRFLFLVLPLCRSSGGRRPLIAERLSPAEAWTVLVYMYICIYVWICIYIYIYIYIFVV